MKNLIPADDYQWQTIKEAQSCTYTRMYIMILISQRKTFFTCQTYNVHPSSFANNFNHFSFNLGMLIFLYF